MRKSTALEGEDVHSHDTASGLAVCRGGVGSHAGSSQEALPHVQEAVEAVTVQESPEMFDQSAPSRWPGDRLPLQWLVPV